MATQTYIPLATTTLTANTSTLTFQSIPQSYRDLVLIVSGQGSSDSSLTFRANGDTGANYSWMQMSGDGSSVSGGSRSPDNKDTEAIIGIIDGSAVGNAIVNFQDYSITNKFTNALGRGND